MRRAAGASLLPQAVRVAPRERSGLADDLSNATPPIPLAWPRTNS